MVDLSQIRCVRGVMFAARLLVAAFFTAVLCATTAASAEPGREEAPLDRQLAGIEKSSGAAPSVYLLAAGLSSKQDVFRNDVESIRDLLDKHWNTANRSVALVASESTKAIYAYPTRANLQRAASAIGQKLDSKKDVLVLFLSSHGSMDGLKATLPDGSDFLFTGVDVRKLLEASGAKYRVVILSACHAGALIDELKDENTLVMTAAHATRTSFGCSFTQLHTWFTQALMDALAETKDFEKAFYIASRQIKLREEGGEANAYSMPQLYVGKAIGNKLTEIEAKATRAVDWTPPVLLTEAGKVRQLLGDYLSIQHHPGRDSEVLWLQLSKVGARVNGTYSISAGSRIFYRGSGGFNAAYDPDKRLLTGDSKVLGKLKLSLHGKRFSGSIRGGEDVVFERVLRREIYEAMAQNPPAGMRAHSSSAIRLLYLGARDCGYCRQWEEDHVRNTQLIGFPESERIEFVVAKRFTLKEKLRKSDLPDNLAYLFDKFNNDKELQPLLVGTPSFVVLVDDKIRMSRAGIFLDSPIYPVLRAAIRERSQ